MGPSDVNSVEAETLPAVAQGGIPFGQRLHDCALTDPDVIGLTVVAIDGTAENLTLSELDRRANQWGRALADVGARVGSYIVLAIPNSVDLVLAALGCWKIGAVPIPVRWDLPGWERSRLLAAIAPTVVIDEGNRREFAAAAARQTNDPVPDAVSPMINGICSSGSTGLPKIILDTKPAEWTPQNSALLHPVGAGRSAADHHGARADVSHQRLQHLDVLAWRRSARGAREVQRRARLAHHRKSSRHQLHRDTDHAGADGCGGRTWPSQTSPASFGCCRELR